MKNHGKVKNTGLSPMKITNTRNIGQNQYHTKLDVTKSSEKFGLGNIAEPNSTGYNRRQQFDISTHRAMADDGYSTIFTTEDQGSIEDQMSVENSTTV